MKKTYTISEFADMLGVTKQTLRNWDNSGRLIAKRTKGDYRFYTQEHVDDYFGHVGMGNETNERVIVGYARVSNLSQKDDLKNQVDFIRNFANGRGIILDDVITDIGSGLNYNRKKWNVLLNRIDRGEISQVICTYKDRFIRFGFDWFKNYCEKKGCELVILNNPDTDPQTELIEDLISIIHVFSSRIYGLRKYKNKIIGDEDVKKDIQDRS